MKTVFEATTTTEAQMILDLLGRSGIPGELSGEPLTGFTDVKVLVAGTQAAEAATIIAEWEATQAPEKPVNTTPGNGFPTGFMAGFLLGALTIGLFLGWVFGTPFETDAIDQDEDGVPDEFYHYRGQFLNKVETDRNRDGEIDQRFHYNARGITKLMKSDDNFDGRFESVFKLEGGNVVRQETDLDGGGHAELLGIYTHGILSQWVYLHPSKNQTIKIEYYEDAYLDRAELDTTGDGVLDTLIMYDRFAEEISREPIIQSEVITTATAEKNEPRPPLDLSAPEDMNFDEHQSADGIAKENDWATRADFNAEALFNTEESSSKVGASITPIIKESDDPDEQFELDGGKISVEIKTN